MFNFPNPQPALAATTMPAVLSLPPLSIADLVAITNLGDISLLLAVGLAVPVWLAAVGAMPTARAWLLAITACGGAVAALKLPPLVCPTPGTAPFSPSGHAALAAQVYGSLALLGGWGKGWIKRGALLTAAAAVVAAIAWSRIALSAHTPLEVAIGLGVGGLGMGLFAAGCRETRRADLRFRTLVLILAVPTALIYGTITNTTEVLRILAGFLRATTGLCG